MKRPVSTLRRRALQLICLLAVLHCGAAEILAAGHAVILQYHHFGDDTPASTSVTMRQFAGHMQYLQEQGFTVLPVEKIAAYAREGKDLPERSIGITIDDAYVSVYEKAFPLLKRLGFPFTVFVPTEGVDGGFGSYLTWSQMREMKDYGATFASHSHRHGHLIRREKGETEEQWASRVREDVILSLGRLKKELGSVSTLFAYPYGEYSGALKKVLRTLDLVGFSQQSGALWAGSDFRALPRFPMASHYAEMDQFREKVHSLPLPVLWAEPEDPVLPRDESMPVLRLKIAPGDYRQDSLSCYTGGQGGVEARWTDLEGRVVEITARSALPEGRSRYNCTARHKAENRYYWYSHLWIRDSGP